MNSPFADMVAGCRRRGHYVKNLTVLTGWKNAD
jgi:hypothetical protein